jgi:hypothetical protein
LFLTTESFWGRFQNADRRPANFGLNDQVSDKPYIQFPLWQVEEGFQRANLLFVLRRSIQKRAYEQHKGKIM